MTKDEYNQKKTEILKQYGEPSDQYDEPNESRKQLNELQRELKTYNIAKARAEKKANEPVKSELNRLAESIPKEKQREYKLSPALPVYLTEEDLKQFTDEERKILLCYFDDMNQSDKDVANRIGTSLQKVTHTRRLPAVAQLSIRAYDYILKAENAMMLRKQQLGGDSKIIVELAKKYGNLDKDSLDITQKIKPIDDPALIKYLREIGSKIVEGE